ncbi:MAG: hypothetical protein COA65_01250 [Rhodospirillaceae bacterium]|nr:MAG: hypothetical protein COA65_01250 [Rhodospirillaceae bacterium]
MWSPHQYRAEAKKKGLGDDTIATAIEQIEAVESGEPKLPAILSLNHLATRAKVPYQFLRSVVQRSKIDTYRKFSIRKRSGGRRFIHVPSPSLSHVQKWLNKYILQICSRSQLQLCVCTRRIHFFMCEQALRGAMTH